jgi:hypothetical protein
MSAMFTGFSAYSPSYENITNRMCRLKQSKSSQNVGQIRPNSAQKVDICRLSTDTRENSAYRAKRRVSPSNLALYDQQFTATTGNYAGGVSRNSGIKKYHQRQLKDIGEGRALVNLKTEGNLERGPILHPIDDRASSKQEKASAPQIEIVRSAGKLNQNMIPGRIYKR